MTGSDYNYDFDSVSTYCGLVLTVTVVRGRKYNQSILNAEFLVPSHRNPLAHSRM
jgi:hypothetical protein